MKQKTFIRKEKARLRKVRKLEKRLGKHLVQALKHGEQVMEGLRKIVRELGVGRN